jgi:fluoroquinolone resistance protein
VAKKRKSEYDNTTFDGNGSLPEALDTLDFVECRFIGCEFRSQTLRGCRFFDCTFERMDASAADLTDSTVRGATFNDCKLLGINWTVLRSLESSRWERCLLDGACFQGLALNETHWNECRLREVDFSDCKLQKTKFHGSDLEGANFARADLTAADFTASTGLFVDPNYVRLSMTVVEMDVVLRMAEALGLRVVGSPR